MKLGEKELYNIDLDPYQLNNLASKADPTLLKQLAERLSKLRTLSSRFGVGQLRSSRSPLRGFRDTWCLTQSETPGSSPRVFTVSNKIFQISCSHIKKHTKSECFWYENSITTRPVRRVFCYASLEDSLIHTILWT